MIEKLGIIEAEQFIYLVKTEQLDYTKWQENYKTVGRNILYGAKY